MIRLFKVIYYIQYRHILQYYSNFLVKMHVRFTPNRSTEDSFTEMLLEHIRWRQRKIEQKRWTLWTKIIALGKEIGIEDNFDDIKPHVLDTEDTLHDKAAENETI